MEQSDSRHARINAVKNFIANASNKTIKKTSIMVTKLMVYSLVLYISFKIWVRKKK